MHSSHTEDDLEQWVIATRRAQGLLDHIEDPAVLARVAELLLCDDRSWEAVTMPPPDLPQDD